MIGLMGKIGLGRTPTPVLFSKEYSKTRIKVLTSLIN
jgi:hypothetical protein